MYKFWKLLQGWCCSPDISKTAQLYDFLNDEEIMQFGDNGGISLDDCRDICSGRYPWFFIYSERSELIGIVALLRSDGESAEVCILLKREWRGMGIGSEVISRLCDVSFISFGLSRLYARVLLNNIVSVSFLLRCGFIPVNILPIHMRIPNEARSLYFVRHLHKPKFSLSVIIPTHNCEKWIRECIGSLDNIPCTIIVSDDASDDDTVNIVEHLAMTDKRITLLVSEKRHFAGGARNAGISIAKGEYLFFLDGDDMLCEYETYNRMLMASCISRADIIRTYDTVYFDKIKKWHMHKGSQYTGFIGKSEYPMMLTDQRPVWMCWFKREYIMKHNIRFAEGVRSYEDNLFTFDCALTAESVVTVSGALTAHRIRQDSLSHILDAKIQMEFLKVSTRQISSAYKLGTEKLSEVELENYFFHSVFLTAIHVWRIMGKTEDCFISDAIDLLKASFPKMINNLGSYQATLSEKDMFKLAWEDISIFMVRYGDI